MNNARAGGKAVMLSNATVMIAGGWGKDHIVLATTELFNGSVWVSGPSLPFGVAYHCMVNVPASGVIVLVGRGE